MWKKNQRIKYTYTCHPDNSGIRPPRPQSKKAWDKSQYKSLKKKIRLHYSHVQSDICAYCHEPISFEGYGEAIEHIIPKSKKYRWMFHPKNICLSCYGCNTKKGTKNPLVQDFTFYGHRYEDFPADSSHYKIIHPHFDTYSKHLYEEKFICKVSNFSTKGEETIKMFKLNRLDLLYTRIRKKNTSQKQMRKILAIVLVDTTFTLKEKQAAKHMLLKIIDRYNYLKALSDN